MSQLKKQIEREGLGLALGGGSVRGFFHIGVLQALEELNIPISYITGISIGSVVGGLYAYGYRSQDLLEILSQHTNFITLLNSVSPSFDKQGFFSGKVMIQEINNLVDGSTIEQFTIPFACRAVDVQNFKEVIFDSGNLGKAVKASCAIPGIFTPEENEDSEMLVDGGALGSVPFALLEQKFQGPSLISNLISYDHIDGDQAKSITEAFSKNIIYKLLPFTETIFRSLYFMHSYISILELEKYKPDLYVVFKDTYSPSITNIQDSKDLLVTDGYHQTRQLLHNIGF
ncbi:MAG: patatin-like phospholipase family protein [Brevinema sp.]